MSNNNTEEYIDIIIPVSANLTLTERCITSVLKQTNYPYRLILVDDGIKDQRLIDYLKNIKTANENVILIAKDNTGIGFSYSVNKGLHNSTSDIVCVLTNDVIVSENWLSRLLKGFSEKETAIIGAKCNNRLLPDLSISFDSSLGIEDQLKKINESLETNETSEFSDAPFVLGHCMLIKRELVGACGGFDTVYGNHIRFSDFDFCIRAERKGFKSLISNKVVVYRHDLESQNVYETRMPINYTIFKKKWNGHKFYKKLPENLFKEQIEKRFERDKEGFYYNNNLKREHKRYLLIHPPIVDTKDFLAGTRISPVGVLRVGHYLINEGNKINYYDFDPYSFNYPKKKLSFPIDDEMFAYGKSLDDFGEYIKKLKSIDEIFITTGMTYNYPRLYMEQLIKRIRDVYGDIKITFGGIYATLCADEIKKLGVEVHVGPYMSADNLRPLIEITDEKDNAIMRVVKGCPRTCSYCVVPNVEGRTVIQYQKENIIKQFQEYYSLGYTNYIFWDSNLLFGKENFYILLDYLKDFGYEETVTLDFSYGLEFALVDDEFVKRIGGFRLKNPLSVPLESSEYELYKDKFNRPSGHLGHITKAVHKLQEANHKKMNFYVMIGLPYQKVDHVLKTMLFGWRLGMQPGMMLFTPIPGTEDYERYRDFYIDKESWELNPYLYPCASDELDRKTITELIAISKYALKYSEHDGFFLENRSIVKNNPNNDYSKFNLYLKDQNKIIKRLRELIYEEDVRKEELDERTFRYFHALSL